MDQPMLPLYDRVIFVDWHNVLSTQTFWASILESPHHPLRRPLQQALSTVFHPGGSADAWMRGARTSADIIADLSLNLGARYADDFLARRLRRDCRRLMPRQEAVAALKRFTQTAFVVLATDNMDCFFDAVKPADAGSPLPGSFWDDVLCSSRQGVLKAEDPEGFFGPWLRLHELRFSDALLIDDRSENCATFERSGGYAVRWHVERDSAADLASGVQSWLTQTRPEYTAGQLSLAV